MADYIAYLAQQEHLRPGMALEAGFDEMDSIAARSGQPMPRDGSIDLCLALHMIYFVSDLVTIFNMGKNRIGISFRDRVEEKKWLVFFQSKNAPP